MQTKVQTAEPAVDARPTLELRLEPEPVRAPAVIDAATSRPAVDDDFGSLSLGRSPLDQLRQLLARGILLEQAREYLALQREWEADEARRRYHAAMAAFKRENLTPILKDQHVKYKTKDAAGNYVGEVDYWHEALESVVAAVVPAMAKHGLTHEWIPSQASPPGGAIKVTCRITHELGHSRETALEAMPDNSGKKNPIQAVKSTISYLERILLLAMTGTAAQGMDNDGRDAAQHEETEAQARTGKPRTEAPRATDAPSGGADPEFSRGYDRGRKTGEKDTRAASEKQRDLVSWRAEQAGVSLNALLETFDLPSLHDLKRGDVDEVLVWIGSQKHGA